MGSFGRYLLDKSNGKFLPPRVILLDMSLVNLATVISIDGCLTILQKDATDDASYQVYTETRPDIADPLLGKLLMIQDSNLLKSVEDGSLGNHAAV